MCHPPLNLGPEGGKQNPSTTVGNALKQIYYSLDKVMSQFFPPFNFKLANTHHFKVYSQSVFNVPNSNRTNSLYM